MIKVDCKDCYFYNNGICEELGEYTTPGECECSWFAPKAIKNTCVAEIAKVQNKPYLIASLRAEKERGRNNEIGGGGAGEGAIDEYLNAQAESEVTDEP